MHELSFKDPVVIYQTYVWGIMQPYQAKDTESTAKTLGREDGGTALQRKATLLDKGWNKE